jgi:DNA-binding MarR family transcriptional regulator
MESDPGAEALVAVEHALTRFIRQATRPAVGKWLSDVGGVSLDRADYVALARIEEAQPIRPTELAELVGIDLSAVSRQVRDLVDSGLVTRSRDASDHRACHLRLTDEGRVLLARVRQARQGAARRLLAGWSGPDQAALARLVGRLTDDIETLVAADAQAAGAAPGLDEGLARVGASRGGWSS